MYRSMGADPAGAEADETPTAQLEQRLFTSSIGFLSRPSTAD